MYNSTWNSVNVHMPYMEWIPVMEWRHCTDLKQDGSTQHAHTQLIQAVTLSRHGANNTHTCGCRGKATYQHSQFCLQWHRSLDCFLDALYQCCAKFLQRCVDKYSYSTHASRWTCLKWLSHYHAFNINLLQIVRTQTFLFARSHPSVFAAIESAA